MLIYVINFAMMAVYSFFNAIFKKIFGDKKRITLFFVLCAALQLILVLALRSRYIGTDLLGYATNFELLSGPGFERYEVGYRLLCQLIASFTDNAQVMIAVVAVLSIVPIGIIIYKYSKMPFLSYALYIAFSFYAFNFSGLRQAIAYGITMLSYKYIRENKFLKFALLVCLAATFHKTAIIFIAAYFICKLKVNKWSVSIMAIAGVIVYVFQRQIAGFVIDMFFDSYTVSETGAGLWMVMCTVIVILGLMLHSEVKNKVGDSADPIYMLLMTGLVMMVFAGVSNNAMRVANYYYMYVILFVPEVLGAVKEKKLMSLCAYGVTLACLVLYAYFLQLDDFNIVPYQFFWK